MLGKKSHYEVKGKQLGPLDLAIILFYNKSMWLKPLVAGHTLHNARELAALIGVDAVGHTADDTLEVGEGIFDLRAVARDHEFADALVVPGTTHLEHVEGPGHFATDLHVLQQQDRVGDGGDMGVGDRVATHELLRGVREEAGDLLLFGITGHPDHELAEGVMTHTAG